MSFCFLDMDGVLVDFNKAVCKAHNLSDPYVNNPKSYGIWNMEKLWGMSDTQFFAPCQYEGFYTEMEKTPDADEIVELVTKVFGVDNVCILSAYPWSIKTCTYEKTEWLYKYYPQLVKNALYGRSKQFLAGRDRYLVDDKDQNVNEFNNFGGRGILVPRLWNQLWYKVDNPMGYLKEALSR